MPDVLDAERARYAGKRVMVVGSGDSALGTLIDLAGDIVAAVPATADSRDAMRRVAAIEPAV